SILEATRCRSVSLGYTPERQYGISHRHERPALNSADGCSSNGQGCTERDVGSIGHDRWAITTHSRPGRSGASRTSRMVKPAAVRVVSSSGIDRKISVDSFGTIEPSGRVLSERDRKSTRLNSSHVSISYAVFCLKKKKMNFQIICISTSRPFIVLHCSTMPLRHSGSPLFPYTTLFRSGPAAPGRRGPRGW